ncbi:hypothetical protein UK12_02425 [Saccharothrix sp. ST-888]|nr:hypothetical protein UK12_02425 [Saccharothrix sp. ST-888]
MMAKSPALRPSASRSSARSWTGELEGDSLASLVSSSRRLGRFWPPSGSAPQAAVAPRPAGVSVPSRARKLVAQMPEYGS